MKNFTGESTAISFAFILSGLYSYTKEFVPGEQILPIKSWALLSNYWVYK